MSYHNYSYPNLNKFIVSDNLMLKDCLKTIEKNENGLVFICDNKKKLLGIITDGDIRRYLIKNNNLNCSVKKVMKKNLFHYLQILHKKKLEKNLAQLSN